MLSFVRKIRPSITMAEEAGVQTSLDKSDMKDYIKLVIRELEGNVPQK